MQNTRIVMDSITESDRSDPREFIRLLMENERRLYAYIRSLLPNSSDAEDVLQETSIVLWDKFSSFDTKGGNFLAWSFKVAFFTVQNFRRKQARSKLVFSDSVIASLAEKSNTMVADLDCRQDALSHCIEKLPSKDRQLLDLRYQSESSIESTASQTGRTKAAVYKALSRLRETLFDCVNRQLAAEHQS